MILGALKEYVTGLVGESRWPEVLRESGLDPASYPNPGRIIDEQVEAIVATVARMTRRSERELYHELGERLAPEVLEQNRFRIAPDWQTIDLIEHIDKSAYEMTYDQVDPNRATSLTVRRPSADEAVLIFSTPRFRTCGLADGIIHGIAKTYGENIVIHHASCMKQGDPSCELIIRKIL